MRGLPATTVAAALSPDGGTLYVLGVDRSGRQLTALDTRSLRLVWRLALNSTVAPQQLDGVWVGGTALAAAPDGTRLFVGSAYREDPAQNPPADGEYIAALDVNTRHVVGTVGPLQVVEGSGLATVPPCAGAPAGLVAAVGTRLRAASRQPSPSLLVTIDPATMTVLDTAVLAPPGNAGPDGLGQVVAAPGGCLVYLQGGSGTLYQYDLIARRVVATAAATPGVIAVAPDGQAVYLTDYGDFFDSPGLGLVRVFGPALEPRPPIDLHNQAALGGGVPRSTGAAVSADGARLYVATGTASMGPLFQPQPLRVAVVDRASGALLRAISLDDFGSARLFVAP